jgi:hypothetical protein
VASRADWRKVFARRGRLIDEYGQHVPNPIAWLDELEAPSAEQIDKETLWLGGLRAVDRFRDPEGFRVNFHEFS